MIKQEDSSFIQQNMYNFLLLDKSTGMVAQIQWPMNEEHRGLVKIISY